MMISAKRCALAAGLALVSSPLKALDAQPVVVTPILSTTVTVSGQPIVLPQKDAQVVVSIFDIPPGVTLPVHRHPFPRYAYVLAGTISVTSEESGQSTVYAPGSFIVEMVGQWHHGTNIGTEPAKLLVVDQVEKGASNTELAK
jgi:quercetin dioxygenase-like cupin family protein